MILKYSCHVALQCRTVNFVFIVQQQWGRWLCISYMRYHQHATADGLSVLAACTTDVKQWYMQNGLQLNPHKSEVLHMSQSAAGGLISDVSICRWSRPSNSRQHESAWRHSRPSPDIWRPRVSRHKIVQLPRTSDPQCTPTTDSGPSTYACI